MLTRTYTHGKQHASCLCFDFFGVFGCALFYFIKCGCDFFVSLFLCLGLAPCPSLCPCPCVLIRVPAPLSSLYFTSVFWVIDPFFCMGGVVTHVCAYFCVQQMQQPLKIDDVMEYAWIIVPFLLIALLWPVINTGKELFF